MDQSSRFTPKVRPYQMVFATGTGQLLGVRETQASVDPKERVRHVRHDRRARKMADRQR